MNDPKYSIATCPVCEGGLCGIRICCGDDPTEPPPVGGFVLCDECEAVWAAPNVRLEHRYLDAESPRCPICKAGLWAASRWADLDDIEQLGWTGALDRSLDG